MKLSAAAKGLARYGVFLIFTLLCIFIIGSVIFLQNVHRYYSQTYLKAEKQILKNTFDNAMKGKEQVDVVRRVLTRDLVDLQTGIDLSKVLAYEKLPWLVADSKGLFLTSNTAKFLLDNGDTLLFVELPQNLFSSFLTSELADVLLVTGNGQIILSTKSEMSGIVTRNKNGFAKLNDTVGYLHFEDLQISNARAAVFIPIHSYLAILSPYLLISLAAMIGVIIWMIFFWRFETRLIGAVKAVIDSVSSSTEQITKSKDVNYVPVRTNIEELNELQDSIVKLLEIEKASQSEMHAMMSNLQDTVNELEEMQRILQERNTQIIATLAEAIEIKDTNTYGHSGRVVSLALDLAKELGLTDPADLEAIKFGALLHDIGKIGIPEHILNKPGRLTFEEF